MKKQAIWALGLACAVPISQGAVWNLDLGGQATSGLSGGNEVPDSGSPATGMELSPNITYDDSSHQLDLHIGWGSHELAGGGTDLQGAVQHVYLQGPADINTASSQTIYEFQKGTIWSPADDSGEGKTGFLDYTLTLVPLNPGDPGYSGSTTYSVTDQQTDLLANKWFFNIETDAHPQGEIRGNLLTPVPEPQTYALIAGLGLLGFAVIRRAKSGKPLAAS